MDKSIKAFFQVIAEAEMASHLSVFILVFLAKWYESDTLVKHILTK